MTVIQILGSGSLIPDWAEALESREFGSVWGPLGEFEILWLADKLAFARWRMIPNSAEAELLHIAVDTAHRRVGVAKRLMVECSKYLAANGCASLHLEVRASNIPAQKLYESLGWRRINVRKAYYGDGEDAAIFCLSG
ncbi:MAG: GNAT family N-acetyltransferase [Holophagales bacterium]|nr:GNAT family N-acetyltransferase [Holophagales bacterium]